MAITGEQFMVLEWVMVFVTLILCGMRFYIRFNRGIRWNWCDFWVFLAWIWFVVQSTLDTVDYRYGLFNGRINPGASHEEFGKNGLATLEETQLILRVLWIQTCIYYMLMYCVKFAMLTFYYDLIPRTSRKLRMLTHVATVLSVVGCVSTFLLKTLFCLPVSTNWAVDGRHCKNIDSPVTDIYRWTFHVLTDLIIYAIPIFLVRQLQMPTSQKIGVAITFSVGFVCIVFANIVQMTFIVTHDPLVVSFSWATGEMSWAILVVCMPTFKNFLTNDLWSRCAGLRKRKSVNEVSGSTECTGGSKESSFFRRKISGGKWGTEQTDNTLNTCVSAGKTPEIYKSTSITNVSDRGSTKMATDVEALPV